MERATRTRGTDVLVQTGVLIVLSTAVLTASFVGLVGLVTGGVTGLANRLPYYSLALALAFVGGILAFEREYDRGETIIRIAAIASGVAFVLVSLSGEGIAFLLQRPTALTSSQSLLYFVAAGLIATGLGYLGMHHWRDLVPGRETQL